MLTARVHNALVRRVRAWTRFAGRLDHRLGELLHADPAAVAVLAGVPGRALLEAPDRAVAADLLVLLDHLNLHAGTRLSVTPLGSWRFALRGRGTGDDTAGAAAAQQFTADLRAGRPAGYRPWPGRIERIAVITCDRPASLRAALDAFDDNLRRFGREDTDITVYDDSDVTRRSQIRSLTAARAIRYVGPEDKHAIRTEIEAGLPGADPERTMVLDALLGRRADDGTWTGSAAAQRNWAILSAAGSRVLVCDDDVRPAVLDAPLVALREAARDAVAAGDGTTAGPESTPGELLERFLCTTEVEAWPTDLLGLLEDTDAHLASAAYTGHPDRRTALWLERFFEASEESVDVLGTGIPPQRVRRGTPAVTGRKFRGGAFASSGSLDGLEFAVRRGRNEDFSLALSALITSRGRQQPAEAGGAHILHLRGPRVTSTFTAHREEREGNVVNAVVRRIGDAHALAEPGAFDPAALRAFGCAQLDAELDRQFSVADVGRELFDEGLAYRDRARDHLVQLQALAGRAAEPDVAEQWYADRATARAALLRDGVERLRDGTVPADPVLMECAQVLVPQGLLSTLHLPAMRHAWLRLSDAERAEAGRCLADEARYLTSVQRPRTPAPPVPSQRISRKTELTRQLAGHIDDELGVPPAATAERVERAREAFQADLRHRIRAEVLVYLTTVPYVPLVRAELGRRLRPQTRPPVGATP
ncbi:hypothetical protein Dvina_19395 [Dactylosporangium vinaceum]|uniref:Glycosyl transferase family 2 n=1 Tax=Dactylosporangium vinaceum TaxID=53362 RepID=A0ABV5M9M4_9ACTN|nr:hypothetical protein [Dactylosporangium vinaceum]UAC00028.1 hypothetical protein Dvina_19395 [Dactylosporangium vinaceum]